MNEIGLLVSSATAVRAAQAEKSQAFTEIVYRFQDLGFGCAYSVLGDFHLAEDATQEAFITAWRNLDQLRKPEAFPGWFKRIVLTQCNRLTREQADQGLAIVDQALSDVEAGRFPDEKLGMYAGW